VDIHNEWTRLVDDIQRRARDKGLHVLWLRWPP
jgi:hypothetical protein